ncbi:hypothetical protein N825_21185 [Skermanella stibiiresistens SB22]|uniref:Glycosyl transferase n=1 Tax=Skermanella stibiiresistens SB22 TaxID=1385369 RepID=W9GXA3_9PROT|nr:hypothetical protein N825_21185 [Skermanella stibiiresistens SB22]
MVAHPPVFIEPPSLEPDAIQKSRTALVTMAIGTDYQTAFQRWYLPGWRSYCERHCFDLYVIDQPVDQSVDLSRKSLHWQKLLMPSLPRLRDYDRVVWVDADIVINSRIAPDLTAGVPPERIGVVDATPGMVAPDDTFNQYGRFLLLNALLMTFKNASRADDHRTLVADMTVEDMYRLKGLTPPVDKYVNTGVIVCSPRHHAEYLLDMYMRYDADIWDFENSAVSWELLSAGIVDFIDPRFNVVWAWEAALHYPFVHDLDFYNANTDLVRMCVNTAYRNAFFLHLAGSMAKVLAPAIDREADTIAELVIGDYERRRASIDMVSCAEGEAMIRNSTGVRWPF